MNVFNRGIQVYLLVVAIIGTVAAIWGANLFVLDNTTAGTGWIVMIESAVGLVALGLVIRSLYLPTEQDSRTSLAGGRRERGVAITGNQ